MYFWEATRICSFHKLTHYAIAMIFRIIDVLRHLDHSNNVAVLESRSNRHYSNFWYHDLSVTTKSRSDQELWEIDFWDTEFPWLLSAKLLGTINSMKTKNCHYFVVSRFVQILKRRQQWYRFYSSLHMIIMR